MGTSCRGDRPPTACARAHPGRGCTYEDYDLARASPDESCAFKRALRAGSMRNPTYMPHFPCRGFFAHVSRVLFSISPRCSTTIRPQPQLPRSRSSTARRFPHGLTPHDIFMCIPTYPETVISPRTLKSAWLGVCRRATRDTQCWLYQAARLRSSVAAMRRVGARPTSRRRRSPARALRVPAPMDTRSAFERAR